MRAIVLLLSAMLGACTAPIFYDYSKEPDPRRHEFIIGASDSLRITVWKNPELSTEARVRPDGTITMPLLGDVQAAGRTPTQLRNEITARLKAFVKDDGAAVSIAVTDVSSYRFTVSGNVEHGGMFNSRYYLTITEAIAMAGGLNRFAAPQKMVIVRSDHPGATRRIPIDFNRISAGEHSEENLVLLSGDTLFVP